MSRRPAAGALYQVRRSLDPFEMIDAKELMENLYVSIASESPDNPSVPESEYYCEAEDCDVRVVRVCCKYLDGDPPRNPPVMCCPSCGSPMKFLHYVSEVALVPADGSGGK